MRCSTARPPSPGSMSIGPAPVPGGSPGRIKQSPAVNLLLPLAPARRRVSSRFLADSRVLFDNAEGDIRMPKREAPPGVCVPSPAPRPSAPSAPTTPRCAGATSSMPSLSPFKVKQQILCHPGKLNSHISIGKISTRHFPPCAKEAAKKKYAERIPLESFWKP